MSKSTMLNCRIPTSKFKLIDEAAKKAGLSRSDFVRNAIDLALAAHLDRGFVPKAVPVSADPVECEHGDFRKLPTGVKVCGLCGTRMSRT